MCKECETEAFDEFLLMFASCLIAIGVALPVTGRYFQLCRHHAEQRRRRILSARNHPAGVSQVTKLNRDPKTIVVPAMLADEPEIGEVVGRCRSLVCLGCIVYPARNAAASR